jgi:beta-glucosidase
MPEQTFQFPEGFVWGTATSSHQVEGNNTNNNWHLWEQKPNGVLLGQRSGLACDWWGGRWAEDFDRAAASGQTSHRMSIEWSRVQPAPDRWDEDALNYYREIIKGMIARGMKPMVTLHHFTHPIWVDELGGWENKDMPLLLAAYVRQTVSALKDLVDTWCTINEPNVMAAVGFLWGQVPPGVQDIGRAFKAMEQMALAHGAAYHAIHEIQPEARAGIVIAYRGMSPALSWSPLDRLVARAHSHLFNDFFAHAIHRGKLGFLGRSIAAPQVKGTQDFFGLNYYSRDRVRFHLKPQEAFGNHFYAKDAELSPAGLIANEPLGFYDALKWATGFGVPVIVTENGIEDADDNLRPRYIAQHIHQLWRAVNDGMPIEGYYHWSLVDNFEWERGWTQRFGLWGLNKETQERIRRGSVDLYEAICKANALSPEMVRKFAPKAFERIYSH